MKQYLASIPDSVLFERGMDDNTFWYTNEVQQLLKHRQPAPLGLASDTAAVRLPDATYVKTRLTSRLCNDNTLQTFLLEPSATVFMFLDAWLPYQTVPIVVTASSTADRARYAWSFRNYVPIGNASMQGAGWATPCPEGVEESPIIRTLGHTARSPTGEYPLSRETLAKTCMNENERPMLVFRNTDTTSRIYLTIAIGQ